MGTSVASWVSSALWCVEVCQQRKRLGGVSQRWSGAQGREQERAGESRREQERAGESRREQERGREDGVLGVSMPGLWVAGPGPNLQV
jgi:hypothetical protein